jgi:putative Holliday junction resolvase
VTSGYPSGPKLGVDVGRVRVGLAGSDRNGLLATPIRTLSRDAKKNSDVRILVQEARERGSVEVFVGLPKNLGGHEAESADMARSYAQLLADALAREGIDAPVRLIDERLSTVSAHRSLRQAGLSTRDHRKVVDQVAAVEILQHAIDMQRSLGRDVGDQVSARRRESSGNVSMASIEEPVISESTLSGKDQEL